MPDTVDWFLIQCSKTRPKKKKKNELNWTTGGRNSNSIPIWQSDTFRSLLCLFLFQSCMWSDAQQKYKKWKKRWINRISEIFQFGRSLLLPDSKIENTRILCNYFLVKINPDNVNIEKKFYKAARKFHYTKYAASWDILSLGGFFRFAAPAPPPPPLLPPRPPRPAGPPPPAGPLLRVMTAYCFSTNFDISASQ